VFEALHLQDDVLRFRLDGVDRSAICHMAAGTVSLALGATVYTWTEASPYPQNDPALDPRLVRASVAGTVRAITVRVGEHVRAGQPLLCIEAMKMEMWLNARADGTVRTIHTQVSDSVATGSVLVDIDIDHTPEESPS
jgi:geranyl-CoA carboxylase alpha subunit